MFYQILVTTTFDTLYEITGKLEKDQVPEAEKDKQWYEGVILIGEEEDYSAINVGSIIISNNKDSQMLQWDHPDWNKIETDQIIKKKKPNEEEKKADDV